VALRRSRALRGLNPLTGLPGNTVIIEETQKLLDASQSFAFLYADLDNFKAYNDHYSFQRGDEVIRALGSAILASLEATPSTARFAGHVGGDDYVAIVEADRGEAVAEDICKRFDAEIRNHYDPDDRERGWIEVEDRRGQVTRFGLCSVSIGIVISSTRGYDNAAEVIAIAAEVKGVAKRTQGSSWAVDRRRD
jgi:diguanylate cyclase (GGDEF)-like protein